MTQSTPPIVVAIVFFLLALTVAPAVHGQAPAATDLSTRARFLRARCAFETKRATDQYRASPKRNPAFDADAERFLTACVRRWNEQPDAAPVAELERQGRLLHIGGCDDPLVRSFYGRLSVRFVERGPLSLWDVMPRQPSNELAAARPFLARAAQELAAGGYDAAFAADAARAACVVIGAGDDLDEIKRCKASLIAAIARASAAPGGPYAHGQRAFLTDDVARWVAGFSAEDLDRLAAALDKGGGDELIRHLIRGHIHNGGAQLWHSDADHVGEGTRHLTRAWELDPTLPEAASKMIALAGSRIGREAARAWFDRAVKARADDAAAHAEYLAVLRRGWRGRPDAACAEIFKFGVEAARGGRFDTGAPRQLVAALNLILHSGGDYQAWARLGAWPEVKRMYEGYLATKPPEARADRDRSALAGFAARLGHYDEAGKLLDALGARLDSDGAAEAQFKPIDLIGDVRAHTGASAELTARGDRALSAGEFKQAAEAFEQAIAQATSPEARRHLRGKARAARWQAGLNAGDWVNLDADADLSGFVAEAGEWTAEPDGSLTLRVTETKSQLTPIIDPGAHWELSCDVAFLVAADEWCNAGVMLGGQRHTVQLLYNQKRVYAGSAVYNGKNGVEVKFGRINRLVVRVQGGRVTVNVNGREVVTQAAFEEWGRDGPERLSLGGQTWQTGDLIRFERVKIRKLAA